MHRARAAALVLIALSGSACILYPSYEINYETYALPGTPWNLESINSPYDDKNVAAPPSLRVSASIVFSTNRARQGSDFDLLAGDLWADFDQDSGSFHSTGDVAWRQPQWLERVNQPGSNELGPRTYSLRRNGDVLLFASDRGGSLDVYWASARPLVLDPGPQDAAPQRLRGLDTPGADESYPSLVLGSDELLLCRRAPGGDGELCLARLVDPDDLAQGVASVTTLSELNSPRDDGYPYTNGDTLVFASDRAGGQGGFDLYLSRRDAAGKWSAPVNLGPRVNSAADELRPVLIHAEQFENDLLVFSSNRPGGRGGYDLWAVGIERPATPKAAKAAPEPASSRGR
ncbi:MAG: hypothetical protein AB7N76_07810 [Planctomycetota bacterium]